MNSKEQLQTILREPSNDTSLKRYKNSRKITKIIVLCLILALFAIILGYLLSDSNIEIAPVNPISDEPEKTIDNQALQEEYLKTLTEYNDAVFFYNSLALDMNSLLDCFDKCGVPALANPIQEKEKLNGEINNHNIQESDLSELKKDVRGIQSESESLKSLIEGTSIEAYNHIVDDYNLLSAAYNEQLKVISVTFISDMPDSISELPKIISYDDFGEYANTDTVIKEVESLTAEVQSVLSNYLVAL